MCLAEIEMITAKAYTLLGVFARKYMVTVEVGQRGIKATVRRQLAPQVCTGMLRTRGTNCFGQTGRPSGTVLKRSQLCGRMWRQTPDSPICLPSAVRTIQHWV